MDVDLLKKLKLIKSIEDANSYFLTKMIGDLAELTLAHPEHVVIVSQNETGLPTPSSWRVGGIAGKLSMALNYCRDIAFEKGRPSRTSIVVREGLYIDALDDVKSRWFNTVLPEGFSVEIVGLGNVRILFDSKQFAMGAGKWKLRNLSIYDLATNRNNVNNSAIFVYGAKFEMEDVNVHAPDRTALRIDGWRESTQSECRFVRCRIFRCDIGVEVMGDSKLTMIDCHLAEMTKHGLKGSASSVDVKSCRFFKSRWCFHGGGKAFFADCAMEGGEKVFVGQCRMLQEDTEQVGVYVEGCGVALTNVTMSNWVTAFHFVKKDTKAAINRCTISDCFSAFHVSANVAVTVTDCEFYASELLSLQCCDKGKVQFKRSKFRDGCEAFVFVCVDQYSKHPVHDLSSIRKVHTRFVDIRPRSSRVSKYTRQTNEKLSKGLGDSVELRATRLYKSCEKCKSSEGSKDKTAKFRFCAGCNRACYCSKECQKADWVDHQVVCSSPKKNKYLPDDPDIKVTTKNSERAVITPRQKQKH